MPMKLMKTRPAIFPCPPNIRLSSSLCLLSHLAAITSWPDHIPWPPKAALFPPGGQEKIYIYIYIKQSVVPHGGSTVALKVSLSSPGFLLICENLSFSLLQWSAFDHFQILVVPLPKII